MPSRDSITKTIRLNAKDRAVVEEIIEKEGCSWSGAIHKIISEGRPIKSIPKITSVKDSDRLPMSEETYRDIENMCRLSGLTFANFMNYIQRLFNDGYIYIEGVAVKTKGDYDLSYLLDACHRANVDPQEMINKLANSLVRR